MGRIFVSAVALLLSITSFAQYKSGAVLLEEKNMGTSMSDHVSYLSSLDGRKAGSAGETAAAEYVFDKLQEYGVEMLCQRSGDVFGLRQENGDTLTSRNVIGCVQGYDSSLNGHYIVVGARMDNLGEDTYTRNGETVSRVYSGANGNASGLAMMLELARMVNTNSLLFRRSVLFVAFGASQESFAGSWYFLNRSFSDIGSIDAMINLDMLGSGADAFKAFTSSNADLNGELASMTSQLLPVLPEVTTVEPYPSDHRSFYSKEIPSVFFSTGIYPEHNTERDLPEILDYQGMEAELEYIYAFTHTLANDQVAPSFRPGKEVKSDDNVYAYFDCDQPPTFMGHADPKFFIQKWVYSYLKYPEQAVKQGIQGRVIVDFVIDKNGKVTDVEVTKGAHLLLDEEAEKVVKASPDWKPGKVKGRIVKSRISIPVEFRLEKNGKMSIGFKKK